MSELTEELIQQRSAAIQARIQAAIGGDEPAFAVCHALAQLLNSGACALVWTDQQQVAAVNGWLRFISNSVQRCAAGNERSH